MEQKNNETKNHPVVPPPKPDQDWSQTVARILGEPRPFRKMVVT
jgi:hypothetical protein